MRKSKLYTEEQHWWSFADYDYVLEATEKISPQRVIEFGPGSSTLALLEGGAVHIDALEDDAHWESIYIDRLQKRFPERIAIRSYVWSDPLHIEKLVGIHYDLALIDGPKQTPRRPVVLEYCLQHCDWIIVPLECTVAGRNSLMRDAVNQLAVERYGRHVAVTETGPLAGAFALIAPKGWRA